MTPRSLIVCALPIMLALSGCGRPTAPSPEETTRVQEAGRAATKAVVESLGSQLKAAIQSGGPVAAIAVCQQVALPLTDAARSGLPDVVAVRRTTLRPRNPQNAPDPLDRLVLERLAATQPLPEELIEWPADGPARFYKPLVILEVCLNCHGDPAGFPPPLTEALAGRYPEDQATGYALGDLRGVIRVDVARP